MRTRPGRLLAVSPHLDDAILSAGATIAAWVEAGGQVVVCTAFAGVPPGPPSPVAAAFHADCGLGDDAISVRRHEDREVLALLGARPLHLNFLDAVYRRAGGRWLCGHRRAMFDPALPDEPSLTADLATVLAKVIRSVRPEVVWTCAGYGQHVDHRLTRRATTRACAGGTRLWLWEDLPYALTDPPHVPRRGRPQVLERPPVEVVARHLERKLAAVAGYRSQLPMLWPGEDWQAALRAHAAGRAVAGGAPEAIRSTDPVTEVEAQHE